MSSRSVELYLKRIDRSLQKIGSELEKIKRGNDITVNIAGEADTGRIADDLADMIKAKIEEDNSPPFE